MDNLISQSSTGGKSSFCEPELAILQVSVHASLKYVDCDHVTRKLLSDWSRCILKLSHLGRTISITQNPKRHRSIWLQRLCEYSKLPNISTNICSISPKILQGVPKTPHNLLTCRFYEGSNQFSKKSQNHPRVIFVFLLSSGFHE